MTPRRAGAAVVAAALLFAAPVARAEPAGSVAVRAASAACAQAPAFTAFVASLRAELAGHAPRCCTIETPDAPPPADTVTLTVEPCDPSAREAVISVGDAARARTVTRRISLADVQPGARPRALALAAAEMLRGVGMAPGTAAAPETAPPGARPVAAADAEVRLYPSLHTALWGARVAISSVGRRWYASLDVGGATGRQHFDAGDVTVQMAGLGLSAGPRLALRRAALDLGLGVEIGWAWIDGESAAPAVLAETGSGLVGAVSARIAVEAPPSWSLRLRAVAQAGEVVRGLRGTVEGAPGAGISGPFVVVGIGVAGP